MLRRLRVLAAFFMVPVVLLAPNPAHAAEWHTVSLHAAAQYMGPDTVPGTLDTIDCSFSLMQTGSYAIRLGTGSCFGLPDVTWGYTQPGEAGSAYTIDLSGQTASASTCAGSLTSTLGPHAKNGTLRVAGTITPGEITVSAPDCSITEVCISFGGGGVSGMDDCATVDIPAEDEDDPTSGGACAAGTPVFTYEWRKVGENMAGYYKWDLVLKLGLTGAPATTARWFAAVQGNYGRTATEELVTAETVFKHVEWEPVAPARPTGVEVYKAPVTEGSTVWQQDFDPEAILIGTQRPATPQDNFAGWTQPQLCRFWFGPKVVFSDATTEDEPAGDGLTAPQPEPDPVEPVVEEPPVPVEPEDEQSFWGAILAILQTIWGAIRGGLAAVVSAVQSLLGAITGLAGAIVDGIRLMLRGTFVPGDGYMETKWAGVSNKWSETAPAKYANTFENFNTGAVSGCSGVPLDVTLPGGVRIDKRLGDACSGQMATAASITQTVLTGVFGIGGALACVRAIGSGLGWNPQVGRQGGAV